MNGSPLAEAIRQSAEQKMGKTWHQHNTKANWCGKSQFSNKMRHLQEFPEKYSLSRQKEPTKHTFSYVWSFFVSELPPATVLSFHTENRKRWSLGDFQFVSLVKNLSHSAQASYSTWGSLEKSMKTLPRSSFRASSFLSTDRNKYCKMGCLCKCFRAKHSPSECSALPTQTNGSIGG